MAEDKKSNFPDKDQAAKDKPEEKAAPSELTGKKKLAVMAGIVVGILLVLGFFTYRILTHLYQAKKDPEVVAEEIKKQKEEEERKKQTEMGATLKEPITVVVNLGSDAERFLKADLVLEYEAEEGGGGGGEGEGGGGGDPEIVKRLPKLKQICIDILSAKSFDELKDPEGRKKVLTQLKNEMNKTFPEPEKIKNVYFNSFIVQ